MEAVVGVNMPLNMSVDGLVSLTFETVVAAGAPLLRPLSGTYNIYYYYYILRTSSQINPHNAIL